MTALLNFPDEAALSVLVPHVVEDDVLLSNHLPESHFVSSNATRHELSPWSVQLLKISRCGH
jgi:hypothetical protein